MIIFWHLLCLLIGISINKMNLRTFDKYHNITMELDETKLSYRNIGLDLPNDNTLIIIDNLLSDTECENIIAKTNGHYHDLSMEYLPTQRQSERILNLEQNMARVIYARIEHIIRDEHYKKHLKPFGFGIDGEWNPIGINYCFRHTVYHAPSVGFFPHRDSSYIHDADTRSILTIVIYLNDTFQGGDTIFIRPNTERKMEQTVKEELENGYSIMHTCCPKKGSALVFNHNVIHAGNPVEYGSKYIIRSDILFKRENTNTDNSWQSDPYFLKAIEYYREAGNQEMSGNVEAAGELYERGLALRQFH